MSAPYENKYPNKIKPELKMSSRLGAFPVDSSTVFNTKEELLAYVLEEGSNAYPGQIVAVANGSIEISNGNKDYTNYIIRSDKTIQKVGSNEIFESISEANGYISTNSSSILPGQAIAVFNGIAYDLYTISKDKTIKKSSFDAEIDMTWDKVLGKPTNLVNTVKTSNAAASVTINSTEKAGNVVLGNASEKVVATSIPTNPTTEQNAMLPVLSAVKAYADSILGANDAMLFKGTISGAAPGLSWTPAAVVGDTYKVSVAGDINLLTLEIGDMLICTADTIAANQDNVATIRNNWVIVQSNIDGAVTGPPSSTGDAIPIFVGNSGKVVQDSGYTIGADGALNGEAGRKTVATETAVKAYADSILGLNSALFFKGTLVYTEADDNSAYGALTPMAEKGWVYLVVAQNTETWERNIGDYAYINDMDSTIGSLLVCINNTDAATEETVDSIALNWAYIPANIPPFKNMVMYSENPVNIKPGLIQPIDQMTIDDYLSNFPSETDAINYLVSHGAPAAVINRTKGEHVYLNALGDWKYIRGNDIRDASIDLATKCAGQSPNTFIMTNSDPSTIDSYAYEAKEKSVAEVKTLLGLDRVTITIKGILDAQAKSETYPYGTLTPAAVKGDMYIINNSAFPSLGYLNNIVVQDELNVLPENKNILICVSDTVEAATADADALVITNKSWALIRSNMYIGEFGKTPNVQENTSEYGTETVYKAGLVPSFAYSTDIVGEPIKDVDYILGGNGEWRKIINNMINDYVISNSKFAKAPAKTIKGNKSVSTGDIVDLTAAEVREIINVSDGANNYVHPTTAAVSAGLVKVGKDSLGHAVIGGAVTKNDITALGITPDGGAALTAEKLKTARTIGVSGKATGSATSFDGQSNITIPIDTFDSSGLYEPNERKSSNITEPLRALYDSTRANKLMFLPADQIIIEKTTDGGVTWVDAGISDINKTNLFSELRPSITIPLKDGVKNINCGLRVTISAMKYNVPDGTPETDRYTYWNSTYVASTERYCRLRDAYFWLTGYEDTVDISIKAATGLAPNTWDTIYQNPGYGFNGDSGFNYINFKNDKTFGGGSSQTGQYWNFRFEFMTRGINGTTTMSTTLTTNPQVIAEIRAYGTNWWTKSNNMMASDHIYAWDSYQNVTFPAKLKAPNGGFEGDIVGNASSASKLMTPRTINGIPFDGQSNIVITDDTKVRQKALTTRADYVDLVLPLFSLDNTNPNLDSYFIGKIILKRGNNIFKSLDINISAAKKYNTDIPNWYMDRTESIRKPKPVTFVHNSIKYFGIYVNVPDSKFDSSGNYVYGEASDFSVIDTIAVYNNNTSTIIDAEIYNSLVYLADDAYQARREFLTTPYVVNPISDGSYKMWHSGNDGAGSGLDADMLDGHDSSAFIKAAGGTMTGSLTLKGEPVSDLEASTKKYVDDAIAAINTAMGMLDAETLDGYDSSAFLKLAGGTMTGSLNLKGAPTTDLEASTKKYVDDAKASIDSSISTINSAISSINTAMATIDAETLDGYDSSAFLKLAGGTMTGSLVLKAAPTTDLEASTKKYVDDAITAINSAISTINSTIASIDAETLDGYDSSAFLKLAGGTMTGSLTLNGAPTTDLEASTKKYVDDAIAAINTALLTVNADKLDGYDSSAFIKTAGGTMTGSLTLKGAPTADLEASTKKYVDDKTKSSILSLTLLAASWISPVDPETKYTYNLSATGVTADSIQELIPGLSITEQQLLALQGANIIDNGQSTNIINLKAIGTVPAIDIPIRVILKGGN